MFILTPTCLSYAKHLEKWVDYVNIIAEVAYTYIKGITAKYCLQLSPKVY